MLADCCAEVMDLVLWMILNTILKTSQSWSVEILVDWLGLMPSRKKTLLRAVDDQSCMESDSSLKVVPPPRELRFGKMDPCAIDWKKAADTTSIVEL